MNAPRAENMKDETTSLRTSAAANSSASYSEKWSLHPGEALRRKRGLSAREQQARAKHPVVLAHDIFESRTLRRKAFHADKDCLIFCGEVREVLGWLREAGVFADCIVTSPPFYGQRDYGVAGQLGLEQKPEEFITKLVDVFCDTREVLNTTGSLWVNLGDTYWNGRGEHKGRDHKQKARRFGLRPQDRRGDGKLCKNKQLLLIPHRIDLIQRAALPENLGTPHFLILDEMNLSHVERYFADLLSLIELPDETMELYRPGVDVDGETQFRAGVEPILHLPPNLFIIGTVNVDETTYMFSPKVLDRANVIEFRIPREELVAFLSAPHSPRMDELNGHGSGFGAAFVVEAGNSVSAPAAVRAPFEAEALLFFDLLRDHSAEFGFRVANEAARFLHFYRLLGGHAEDSVDWFDAAMDAIIVQKLLPKLHGSRPKLEGLLWALAWACGAERTGADVLAQCREAGRAQEETKFGPEVVERALVGRGARYPLSFDKVMRMWRKLVRDQFVTFSDA